jgi:hypothetical protein
VSPQANTPGNYGGYANQTPAGSAGTITGGFNTAVGNAITGQGWNPQSQIGGMVAGAAAPGIAQAGLQSATALEQAGLAGPAMQLGAAQLESSTGYDIANALLNYEGIGLQSQGLAQQAGFAGQQQQLEEQQFATSQSAVPEQLAEAKQQYGTAVLGQEGQAAASGATSTVGNRVAQQNLTQNYGWQQADIYRNQALAQLGQQSEQVGYQGTQAQFGNQQRQLQLAAQGAGIPVQQAESQLQYGLGALGIQGSADVQSALSQAASAQGQQASDWNAVLSLVGATTGLGPAAFSGGG